MDFQGGWDALLRVYAGRCESIDQRLYDPSSDKGAFMGQVPRERELPKPPPDLRTRIHELQEYSRTR
jgi:hypothetical protein